MVEPKVAESPPPLAARVAAHLSACLGRDVPVESARPLAGGACQENFVVTADVGAGRQRFVLRSDAKSSLMNSVPRRVEAVVVNAAVARKVMTPPAMWATESLVRDEASCYFMPWVPGVAIGRKVVSAPELARARRDLAAELADQLARIHSITPTDGDELFSGDEPISDPAHTALTHLGGFVEAFTTQRPAMTRVIAWLQANQPAQEEVVLNHGDFRTGNFMVVPDGLAAVLDWEFSHWGSPAEDLAWICVRDWRFGRLDHPVGGFAPRAAFLAAYEAASGRELDVQNLLWWEVMGNARWAVGAMQQAVRYLTGQERDIEHLAIGRRTVEMEWEALRLIRTGVPQWRSA